MCHDYKPIAGQSTVGCGDQLRVRLREANRPWASVSQGTLDLFVELRTTLSESTAQSVKQTDREPLGVGIGFHQERRNGSNQYRGSNPLSAVPSAQCCF